MNQEKMEKLQAIEQNLHGVLSQKQALQSQLAELDSAVTELAATKRAYKIVGGIMVEGDPEHFRKELQSKKEIVEMRISAIDKQEKQLRETSKQLQKEVTSQLKEKNHG